MSPFVLECLAVQLRMLDMVQQQQQHGPSASFATIKLRYIYRKCQLACGTDLRAHVEYNLALLVWRPPGKKREPVPILAA